MSTPAAAGIMPKDQPALARDGRAGVDMRQAESVRLQCDCEGIDWLALIDLFKRSDLGGGEGDKVRRSFENSDVVCFAFDGPKLVGSARALSDFEYHATIYDVAVHPDYQKGGIGTRIIDEVLSALPVWRILLVADEDARLFYSRFGFESFGNAVARIDRLKLYDQV